MFLTPVLQSHSQPPLGTFFVSFVHSSTSCLQNSAHRLHVSTLCMPSEPLLRNQFVVCRQLHSCNTTTSAVFWKRLANAHRLTEFVQDTTDDSHANQDYRRGGYQSRETQKHTQLSCRRSESPTTIELQVW